MSSSPEDTSKGEKKTNNAAQNFETSDCVIETIMGRFVADPLIPSAAFGGHHVIIKLQEFFSQRTAVDI